MVAKKERKDFNKKRMFDLNEFGLRNYIKNIVSKDNMHPPLFS